MMRRGWWLVVVSVIASMGCSKTGSMDSNTLLNSGLNLVKAATLSDAEVKSLADAACAESDRLNKVAPAKNKYSVRLAGIMKKFGPWIDGTPTRSIC